MFPLLLKCKSNIKHNSANKIRRTFTIKVHHLLISKLISKWKPRFSVCNHHVINSDFAEPIFHQNFWFRTLSKCHNHLHNVTKNFSLIWYSLIINSFLLFRTYQQTDEEEVITFLLSTEIIPLCLRIMESGSELSKTVATFILQKILLDDKGLSYICQTYERFSHVAIILVTKITLRHFLHNWILFSI